VLLGSDRLQLSLLKLSRHLKSSNGNAKAAQKLIALLREKRPSVLAAACGDADEKDREGEHREDVRSVGAESAASAASAASAVSSESKK
jgi:hypothetical protein